MLHVPLSITLFLIVISCVNELLPVQVTAAETWYSPHRVRTVLVTGARWHSA